MRNPEEILRRLDSLVGYLATTLESEESSPRVHARALELVWVLHPEVGFYQHLQLLTEMIEKRKEKALCLH